MNMKNLLGKRELLALAIGQVIGAGVITVLGAAIAETGRSVWLAYALAVVLGYVLIFPYVILSSVFKLEGGFYSIVKKLAGNKWAGMFILLFVPQVIMMSLFGTSMGMYVQSIAPSTDLQIVGIVTITFFYLINLTSASSMARVQKLMTAALLVTLLVFSFFGLTKIDPGVFEVGAKDFFLNGPSGFMSAVILLVYSTTGYYLTVNYGGISHSPKKDIPWAMNVTAIVLMVVYTVTAITASGVLPVDSVANKPLTFVAEQIFGNKVLSVLFVIGGPILALCSTMNGCFASWGRVILKATDDGWFPEYFGKLNKSGQPTRILTFIFLVGIIPLLFNVSITMLTKNVVFLINLANIIPLVIILRLPTMYPQEWKKSKYYMSNKVFYTIMTAILILQVAVILFSGAGLSLNIFLTSSVYIVFGVFYALYKNGKIEQVVTQ